MSCRSQEGSYRRTVFRPGSQRVHPAAAVSLAGRPMRPRSGVVSEEGDSAITPRLARRHTLAGGRRKRHPGPPDWCGRILSDSHWLDSISPPHCHQVPTRMATAVIRLAVIQDWSGQSHGLPVSADSYAVADDAHARFEPPASIQSARCATTDRHSARRRLASASASQPRRSRSGGTLDRYGLRSRIGVPSSMSTPATRSRQPSRAISSTTVNPIALGRCGDRVANTPWGRSSEGGHAVSATPSTRSKTHST